MKWKHYLLSNSQNLCFTISYKVFWWLNVTYCPITVQSFAQTHFNLLNILVFIENNIITSLTFFQKLFLRFYPTINMNLSNIFCQIIKPTFFCFNSTIIYFCAWILMHNDLRIRSIYLCPTCTIRVYLYDLCLLSHQLTENSFNWDM